MKNLESRLILRTLGPDDGPALKRAVADWDDPAFTFAFGYSDQIPYADYLNEVEAHRRGEVPEGLVGNTMLFAFLEGEIVGRLSLRHQLNENLKRAGGHIGYGVLPKFRNQGVAKYMLKASFPFAKALGLTDVLLTCDEHNVGSIKTIEACGGVLEGVVEIEPGHPRKCRYWIALP